MLRYLLLLFLLLAIAECVALYWLATRLGLLATIGLLLAAGIVGSILARRQGMFALDRLQRELNQNHVPGDTLFDGVLILIAAALLILPGILSDVAAIALLLPPIRNGVKRLIRHRLSRGAVHAAGWSDTSSARDRIIDVEVTEVRSNDVARLEDQAR